jgi:ABC-type nitrate/sulfonate/bicarbonate transport system permease component
MAVARRRALPARSAMPAMGRASLWREHGANTTRVVAVLAFLACWEALARSGAVSPLFLSSPRRVGVNAIWPHVLASGEIALLGFALALAVGLPVGAAMGRWATVRHALEPFVMAKYAAPTVAFLPLLVLGLGIGPLSKVALVFLGAVVVLIINTEAGVASVDRRLVETARAFTAGEWAVLTKVMLPAALPFVVAAARLAVGRVLILVVVAEMYASTAGLGYLVFQGAANYDAAQVFAGVAVLASAGIGLNEALRLLERRLAPWRHTQEE